MGQALLIIILTLSHVVVAFRILHRSGTTVSPDIAGLWFQRRTVMGMGILDHRFFDIVKHPAGFRAFPITACSSGGNFSDVLGLGNMSCDEEILISITEVATSAGKRYVATKTTKTTQETVTADVDTVGQKELRWNDDTVWELHTEAVTLLNDWDDEECRALSGPAVSDPLEYEVYGGVSASLEATKPGATIDMFACVQYDWLQKHKARFECIIRKASEIEESNRTIKQEIVANALSKLQEVMSNGTNPICVPSVCIGISFTKFPIPVPVPCIALFVAWPTSQDQCNGANIREAIQEVQEQVRSDEPVFHEWRESSLSGMHGWAVSVFPVPNVAYFVMGTFHASRLFGGRTSASSLLRKARKAATKIEHLIVEAIEECPTLSARFECHTLNADVKASLAQSQTQGETLRIVAKSFPELATIPAHKGTRLGFGAGTYGQIGWLGFSVGVFVGGSFKFQALAEKYQGCPKWKRVVDIWYASPLSELAPEQIAALARPPSDEHLEDLSDMSDEEQGLPEEAHGLTELYGIF